MPAFVRSVKEISQGYGSVSNYGSVVGVVQAGAGTVTITTPATGATTPAGGTAFNTNGGPPPSRGRWRARLTALGGATTAALTVTVTDGSTVLNVFSAPATAASTLIDWTGDFSTDLNITSVTMVMVLGTSGGTVDFEVAMT